MSKRAPSKFIEIGFGNTWFVRTEVELENGEEYEEKWIKGPVNYHSAYIRVWLWKCVFILDTKEGFKTMRKNRRKFKFILGVVSKQ